MDAPPAPSLALKPEPETCPLAPALARTLGWSDYVVDCGALKREEPSSEWQRARACLLTAQRSGIAFKLSYQLPSYDSLDSAGIAARGAGQRVNMFLRSSTPSAPWRMRTSLRASTCAELKPRPDCSVSAGDLCLACEDERGGATLCEDTSSLPKLAPS